MLRSLARGRAAAVVWCSWMWTIIVGVVATSAAASVPAPGEAASALELRWDAPEGCPSATSVRARVEDALGDALADAGSLTIDARLSPSSEGFDAELELRGPWGASTRSLHSPTCETLVEAVVLLAVVSVTEGPGALPTVPEPEPEPEPSEAGDVAVVDGDRSESDPNPDPDPSPSDDETRPPTDNGIEPVSPSETSPPGDARDPARLGAVVRLEAHAGGALLPGGDFGATLATGLTLPRARAELLLSTWLPQTQPVEPAAEVRLDLLAGELRGCGVLSPRDWLRVLPCGGLELGAMRGQGRGSGLAPGRTSWQPWVALAATPALSFIVRPRIAVWLGGSLVVPLRRVGFAVDGAPQDVYRVPLVAGRGRLGLEVRLR